ncbi:MAG: SGNH/GDSL hydrolase family protein [Candidatus Eremiobacteraeota bacterium]|nr:SGNH/GDSL hydrolase family protein [Candidatus Eremiobacteraeota bacterium]
MRIAVRLTMVAFGLLLGALLLEVGLRMRTAFDNHRVQVAQTQKPTGAVQMGEIVRFIPNRRLVYGFRPELDVSFQGQPLRTNREGFRDLDHQIPKPLGKRRVLFLGDSILFGWCLPVESRYSDVLARLRPDWEVLNMGLPGYNAAQEIECLRVYGLPYQPDLVVINVVGNDAQMPNFIQRSPTDPGYSFLLDWFRGRLSRETLLPPQMQPGWVPGKVFLDDDPTRVPEAYREMVGWEAVRRAYRELAELGRVHHFQTACLAFPGTIGPAEIYCREAAIPYWDFQPVTDRIMKERNIQDFSGSSLAISPTDGHPGALLNQACGEFLAEKIARR